MNIFATSIHGDVLTFILWFASLLQPMIRYYQQLLRYARVLVPASRTITVTLEAAVKDLAAWDDKEGGYLPGHRGWSLGRPGENSTFTLMAGLHAAECTGGYGTAAKPSGCDLPSVSITVSVPQTTE